MEETTVKITVILKVKHKSQVPGLAGVTAAKFVNKNLKGKSKIVKFDAIELIEEIYYPYITVENAKNKK